MAGVNGRASSLTYPTFRELSLSSLHVFLSSNIPLHSSKRDGGGDERGIWGHVHVSLL